VEFSYFYFFLSLCERTLNVRGFPVREEGQVAWLQSPNGLSAAAILRTADRQFQDYSLRDRIRRELVNRPFQFHKRSQLFICAHNEMLSVAMRSAIQSVAPLRING
jgi:hypothetical protein